MLHVSNTPLADWLCVARAALQHTTGPQRAGMAQLVQRPTEKPGALGLLTPVPGEKTFLPESTFSADSLYGLYVQSYATTSART